MNDRDCTKYESWLYEYVDGELPPIARAEFEEALKECPELARRVKELQMLDERLQEVFLHFAPPEDIERRILEGLPDPKRLLGVPLFGEIAAALGFVTREAVVKAIQEQKRRKLDGKDSLIGEILVEMGEMTPDQVAKTLEMQKEQGRPETLGGFEIIEQVGRGGMGVVYRARQLSMDRDVAVKILYPRLAADRKFVESFLKEAHAVAQLNHPNIITGIDAGEERGYIYLAMEYVDGPTLRQVLKRDGKIPEDRAVEIAIQAAAALEYARKQNFIHRDVKPDNIMLSKSGIVKVCDLGLAKRGEEDLLAEEGEAVGTPHYLSPEQATGRSDIDTRSDIYSLGATLYHAVTGTTPFTGKDAREIMSKHVSAPLEPPRKREPSISEGLEAIIMKMMAKNPDERYATPADLIRDLEALKAGRPPIALQEKLIREGKLDPGALLGRKKRSVAVAVAAVLVLAVAGAAFLLNRGKETPTAPPSRTPAPTKTGPTPTPTPPKPSPAVPPEVRREMLAALRRMPADKPEDILARARKAAEVRRRLLGTAEGAEAAAILKESLEKLHDAAAELFARRKLDALKAAEEGRYLDALDAFDEIPDYATVTPSYRALPEMLREVRLAVESAVKRRLEKAKALADEKKFVEAESELAKLLHEAPPEYRLDVQLALEDCRTARTAYARRQCDLALAAILDHTLNGEFEKARGLLERCMSDPLMEPFRERFKNATEYIAPIEEVMAAALDRLKSLVGKRVKLRLAGEYEGRKFKVKEVTGEGIKVMEIAPGMPRRTLKLSDIDPASIAELARHSIMRRSKPEEKGLGLHALAIYLLFSGRFYDAEKTAEEAEKFGASGESFASVKRKYRRMLLNRFATALLREMESAFESRNYDRVLELGARLEKEFGESDVVPAKRSFIANRVTRAKLAKAGLDEMFHGRISVTDSGYVSFDYDFKDHTQLADFAFDPEIWKPGKDGLAAGENPGYDKGLHHLAVFAKYAEMEAEYRNDRPNSVCFRLCGNWFGVNSYNGTGGIIPAFDRKKLWDGFAVEKTGFAFRMDGFYHRLRVAAQENSGVILADGKKLLEGRISSRPSSFEMRDLGYAFVRKLRITGELDEKWLAVIGDISAKIRAGELARGLERTVYSDLYFSRRVKSETVQKVDAKFELSPYPKRIKEPVWSMKYTGYFLAPETAEYSFHLTVSARVRLRIDGAAIADTLTTGDRAEPNVYAKTEMEAGLHRFELFVANDGERFLVLRMRYDGGTGGDFPVPAALFFHEPKR